MTTSPTPGSFTDSTFFRNEGEILARHFLTQVPVRLRWAEGRITDLAAGGPDPSPALWLAPALVDLQINGFAGIDFQQDRLPLKGLLTAIEGLRQAGCTRFLATLMTAPWPAMMSRLRHLRMLREGSAELQAAIAGWHLEGPFLSNEPGFRGAHDPAAMCNPTSKHIAELRESAGSDPVLLTLAPERPGAIQAIALATSLGIKISLGHTNAPAGVLRKAVQAGATGFTHLGNGCPRELNRHDNILWRVWELGGVTCGLIPDAIHVSPPLFRFMHRLVNPSAIYYTTDAMAAAGAPPGRYWLDQLEVEVGADQVVRLPGSPLFAGSALPPIEGVRRAARMLGCSWREVWPRFSEVPARFMGWPPPLQPGAPADFCLLSASGEDRLEIEDVYAGGRRVRRRSEIKVAR